RQPDVCGVGLGRADDGGYVVIVNVTTARITAAIPAHVGGVPVRARITGPVRPRPTAPSAEADPGASAAESERAMTNTEGTEEEERTSEHRRFFQELLERWAEVIVDNDAEAFTDFTEPDWEIVGPSSGPVPLQRYLDVVRDGHLTHSEMSFEVLSVRHHGDVAVVVAYSTNRGELAGQPFTSDEWVTEYFVRRGDRWRCQLSALTPRTPAAE